MVLPPVSPCQTCAFDFNCCQVPLTLFETWLQCKGEAYLGGCLAHGACIIIQILPSSWQHTCMFMTFHHDGWEFSQSLSSTRHTMTAKNYTRLHHGKIFCCYSPSAHIHMHVKVIGLNCPWKSRFFTIISTSACFLKSCTCADKLIRVTALYDPRILIWQGQTAILDVPNQSTSNVELQMWNTKVGLIHIM